MAEPRTVRADANALNSEEIAALLPHRYPFALVDRILDYEPGQWAIGRKCVSRNEEFFCGHFPGQPVMPGVLILEALARPVPLRRSACRRTRANWPSSAASRMPASASRSPPAMCSPCTVTGRAARPGGRGQSLGVGGRQVRRHRRADLCADRPQRLKTPL